MRSHPKLGYVDFIAGLGSLGVAPALCLGLLIIRLVDCQMSSSVGHVDFGYIVLGTLKCSRLSTIRAWARPVLSLEIQMDRRLDGLTLMQPYP